jgi:hypothetical protein
VSTTIKNKLPSFKRSLYNVLDDAFKEGARDTLINALPKTPFDMGGLKADSDVKKIADLHWRVSFNKEYASVQELKEHKNYTTSGTGAHFLKNAGDEQRDKIKDIARKHGKRARA